MSKKDVTWIAPPQAARILGLSYQRVRDLMFKGRLGETRQEPNGRWWLTQEGVEAYRAERERS